jgi:cleavage stimulation factor subunit 2
MPSRSQPISQQPSSQSSQPVAQQTTSQSQQQSGAPSSGQSNVDQEKAALIMQVLQLTEEQIAILPLEQRQSILLLKEQIAQSAGGLLN